MQAAAPLPAPLPGPMVAPVKMPAYDVPGKYLSFEEKPFTDRMQAMEESRLAALHYSTGLNTNNQEHQGILLGDGLASMPKQRKFRLGRRSSSKAVPPPPAEEAAKGKLGWPRKLSIRRRKQAPQHPQAERAAAAPQPPAFAPAPALSLPPPPPIAGGEEDEDEPKCVAAPTPVASPRSEVRQYLETLGHPADATEAVILAFTEAEYAPAEWMPELQDMQRGNALGNFLELCSTAVPDLHAKAAQVQSVWRGFAARQFNPQCKAAMDAVAARTAYSSVVNSYCPTPVVAPTPADDELDEDESTDGGEATLTGQVVRLSFAFVTASEKLELVLSPSTPGHAARVSREIIEDRRRSSMIAHSVVCDAGGTRDHVGMCRDEIVGFASDVVRMATSKLSSGTGPIWVNPTWESGEPERVDDC